jgi:acyl carrier protein
MTDREALRQALKELLEEERGEACEALDENATFREDLGLDSVDLVSLAMGVKERLEVDVADEELDQLRRVGDLLDLLERKRADRRAA